MARDIGAKYLIQFEDNACPQLHRSEIEYTSGVAMAAIASPE